MTVSVDMSINWYFRDELPQLMTSILTKSLTLHISCRLARGAWRGATDAWRKACGAGRRAGRMADGAGFRRRKRIGPGIPRAKPPPMLLAPPTPTPVPTRQAGQADQVR
jgi:hypothetical protein